MALISSASECGTVHGLHSKVALIGWALRLQGSSECGFHSSFAAVATFEGDTVSEKGRLS
jgi:hypothetical protein